MSDGDIPEEVQRFIAQYIDSVAKLEALLMMYRKPEQVWDAALLAQRLYISPNETEPIVKALAREGFCQPSGQPGFYCYKPNSPQLGDVVARVAEAYAIRLIPVTALIHQRAAPTPSRNLQMFADAFKLKKDKEI